MGYKSEMITELTAEIKAAGFRVFVAESGTYGFFTDAEGTRVISFGSDLGSINFSGNYTTDHPRQTGTGWGIVKGWHGGDYAKLFDSHPPAWAVGSSNWKLTTLERHLKTYQASSKYTEVE